MPIGPYTDFALPLESHDPHTRDHCRMEVEALGVVAALLTRSSRMDDYIRHVAVGVLPQ
jgi:hypothetical protein